MQYLKLCLLMAALVIIIGAAVITNGCDWLPLRQAVEMLAANGALNKLGRLITVSVTHI